MTDITIPPEALEAAAIVLMSRLMVSQQDALHVWSGMYEPEKEQFRREARAACFAMLKAWPGMVEQFFPNSPLRPPGIFLPLTENTND